MPRHSMPEWKRRAFEFRCLGSFSALPCWILCVSLPLLSPRGPWEQAAALRLTRREDAGKQPAALHASRQDVRLLPAHFEGSTGRFISRQRERAGPPACPPGRNAKVALLKTLPLAPSSGSAGRSRGRAAKKPTVTGGPSQARRFASPLPRAHSRVPGPCLPRVYGTKVLPRFPALVY